MARRLALAAVLAVVLAGCGSDDEPAAPTATTASTATTERVRPRLDSPAPQQMRGVTQGAEARAGVATTDAAGAAADAGFLRIVFDSAQDLWRAQFASANVPYEPAHLIFFHTLVHTPCGEQDAGTGPFYCPGGHGVYLNTDFFAALADAYGLNSGFASGYVTAHELGHHVQQLLGVNARVSQADARDPAGANARSIQVELQADCYAGIWLHAVARSGQLGQDDVQQILRAAAVVGDDYQRNRAGAELAPETWTHGSSEQRVHWVSVGKDSGDPGDCDTFGDGGS
jgi:predicted metalloprotease